LVREDTSLSAEEYFWKNLDLNGKVVLDAGTGYGYTTLEIAKKLAASKRKGKIVSVDMDSESFELAEKLLSDNGLQHLVTFVRADLSCMPEIRDAQVDIVISTSTICAINSNPCRVAKALSEFYRVLKDRGQIVLGDECPLPKARSLEERVAVLRWQLVKAISDISGERHYNEVEPNDLEFIANLVGFRECRYAIFKGEAITEHRMNHFLTKTSEMTARIDDLRLRNAFLENAKTVVEIFRREGGVFAPRYIFHARK